MKQNFIFVFVLLATLSMVNAIPTKLHKRATIFQPCPDTPVLDVTNVVPDPLVSGIEGNFYVYGKLPHAIPKGSILAALFYDISGAEPQLIDYIAGQICTPKGAIDCPYPAKKVIDVILSGDVPALPDSYAILVLLGDNKLNNVFGCARAFVGGSSSHLTYNFMPSITATSIV